MDARKKAMNGEGEVWKCVEAERTSRRGELDSFTRVVSEICEPRSLYIEGVALVRAEGTEVVEGTRYNFCKEVNKASCI